MRAALRESDAVPGVVASIQTFGTLLNWHPHLHLVVTDGVRERVVVLQREEASEARVRAELPGKTYIHLATHGIVENRRDDVYAALALTPGPGRATVRGDDGFLELSEIYGLHVDAELVVLSACSTHQGGWIEGDGVFALSRGFLAAGCQRVVGSLWQVDDASTAEMIGSLFMQLAQRERSGARQDYARALRDARLHLLHSARWRHPYYWAPFVILGPN
jgi:CHAT domain-containing protein